MRKKKHTIKYRVSCTAPSQLTEFNVEWNNNIKKECKRSKLNLFTPHPGECQGCKYLDLTRLG